MKKVYILFFLLITLLLTSQAQLVTTNNSNGNQLAQILAGAGVTVSNVQLNCPNGATGSFIYSGSNFGITDGILLTTGKDSMAQGPNNVGSQGQGNSLLNPGDADLDNISSATTYDACILEFDMQVISDSVEFKYSFGSEEYLEWVNSGYNDVFGFFISGPGVPFQNIALVPGTAVPVTIDNVNTGSYSQYYNDNGDGYTAPYNTNPSYIQYDGYTTVLTAKKKGLQPCQTYHLKLAIADAGDDVYDSGVFLQANSLISNGVTLDSVSTDVPSITNAVEGCVRGVIRFNLETAMNFPYTVHYGIGGNAQNGIDYLHIADSITFNPGDTSAVLFINPVSDGLVEGTERVVIYLYNNCNINAYDSSVLFIIDSFGVSVSPNAAICAGDNVQLNATGATSYSWSPAAGLNFTNIANPIATPNVTTVYKCTTTVGICQAEDSVTISVVPPPFTITAGPDLSTCTNPNVQLNVMVTGTTYNGNPFVYAWTPATGLNFTNIPDPIASPATSTPYVITVSSGTCKVSDTIVVTIGSISIAATSTDESCYGYHDGTATVTTSTGSAPFIYNWSNNQQTSTITGLLGGNYFVTVVDANNCSAAASVVVQSTTPIVFSNPLLTSPKCFGGSDGNISVTATGGAGNISYMWSTGANNSTANNLSANVVYTITATDANQCSADTAFTLAQPAAVDAAVTTTNTLCFGGSDGTAHASQSGGTGPYTYFWNTNETTQDISGLGTGTYTVVVSDVNQCTAMASGVVAEPQQISITASSVAPKCAGNNDGTINANATGGTSPFQFTLMQNGVAVGNNSTGSFANLASGNFTIDVTDVNGCPMSANIFLLAPNPDAFVYGSTGVSCFGEQYADGTITAVPVSTLNQPYTYSIDNGGNQLTGEFTNLNAGVHHLTIINNFGCVIDTDVVVTQPQDAILEILPADSTIVVGQNITLTPIISNYNTQDITSYQWEPAQGLSCTDCANPVMNGYHGNQYTLTITYGNNCVTSAITKILVQGRPPVFIPNAFSPNGDGNNDVFQVYGESIQHVDMKIFNRWGELVYVTNSMFDGWDGTYRGEKQNPSVFTYETTITYLDGKQIQKKGSVMLMR